MTEQTHAGAVRPDLDPLVEVSIDGHRVIVDGRVVDEAADKPHDLAIHTIALEHARPLGRPVYALATDANGRARLIVHPDGHASDVVHVSDDEADDLVRGAARAAQRRSGLFDEPQLSDGPQPIAEPQPIADPLPPRADESTGDARAQAQAQAPARPLEMDRRPVGGRGRRRADVPSDVPTGHGTGVGGHRKSFIANEPAIEPARVGWRGAMTRMGVRTKPSREELAFRDDVRQVSQHWPGPRTIAIANPKGSANKTPTMLCLSAIFGRYGGAGVLGWDNNETRGTAAWRSRKGPHEATVLDLLPYWEDLLGSQAQAAQLAHYVHHQPADKFDVLWSDQSTASEHEMTGEEVRQVHEVAAKYYRLIFMDSGNSERASNWRAMIAAADQLVVPCTNVEDTAEAGARMLEALAERDEHSAALARNAVAIVSQRTPGKDPNMARIVDDFAPLVRTVVSIPHDPGLYSGVINFDALDRHTQRAWLRAGAAVSKGF